jgi:GT2 family glycosyltransferase
LLLGFQEFPQAVACGGIQRLPQDATDFQKKVFFFMKRVGFITEYMRKAKQKKIKEVNHNASCNVIYRKDAFLSEGGFLEGLWPGEDVELDYRLSKRGYKLVFNPQAIVYHYRPRDLKSFLKMMYRYGLAQGFLVKKYGIFRKIQLVPLFVLTVILITSICLLWNWQIGLLGIVVLIILLYLYFALNLRILGLGITGILIWNIGFLKKILSFK